MSGLMQAILFLCDTLFSFYMLAVLLRILLQWVRADFYNPVCQMVLNLTNFFVIPLRRIIPAYYGMDWASIVLLFILAFVKQGILILLETKLWANAGGLALLGLADMFNSIFYVYLFSTLVMVVVSWFPVNAQHPLVQIVLKLMAPPLAWIRRFLPQWGGIDLSPMVLVMGLILFNLIVVQEIVKVGVRLIIS